MSLIELKNILHRSIDISDDERLMKLLIVIIQEHSEKELPWGDLSNDEQKAIEKGIAELDKGKGIPHKEMIQKYRQWL